MPSEHVTMSGHILDAGILPAVLDELGELEVEYEKTTPVFDPTVSPRGVERRVAWSEDFWRRARRGKRPTLEMHIGKPITLPPITTKGSDKHEARQQNADLVMSYLAGLLPEEYRGVYAGSAIVSS